MRCPRCQTAALEGTWRSRVRRGDKEVWIRAACWRCPACRSASGSLLFLTPELEDCNDALAARVWQETFAESIPPPLVGTRLRRRMRTPEGRSQVAAVFGRVLTQRVQEECS